MSIVVLTCLLSADGNPVPRHNRREGPDTLRTERLPVSWLACLLVSIDSAKHLQDCLASIFVANARVDHGMEELAVRPVMAIVVFHELPAVFINGVHQMDGLRFVAETPKCPSELKFARGIQKHTKSVCAVA